MYNRAISVLSGAWWIQHSARAYNGQMPLRFVVICFIQICLSFNHKEMGVFVPSWLVLLPNDLQFVITGMIILGKKKKKKRRHSVPECWLHFIAYQRSYGFISKSHSSLRHILDSDLSVGYSRLKDEHWWSFLLCERGKTHQLFVRDSQVLNPNADQDKVGGEKGEYLLKTKR